MTGELEKWIEADLLQEHYNRWLEDIRPIHRLIFVKNFEFSLLSLKKKSYTYSALEEGWGMQRSTNSMEGMSWV